MGERGQISWKTSLQRYGPCIPFTMLVFRFAIRIIVVEIKLGPTLLRFYFDLVVHNRFAIKIDLF